jgi:hypothetical protein
MLETNKKLSLVNAELDLKGYIYERYKRRIDLFQKGKENLIEIDLK